MIGYPAIAAVKTKVGTWEQVADAYLYLGQRDKLMLGGEAFDLEGTTYGNELRRRWRILFPKPPEVLPKSDGKEHPLFQRIAPAPPALPRVPHSIEMAPLRTAIALRAIKGPSPIPPDGVGASWPAAQAGKANPIGSLARSRPGRTYAS